MKVCLNSILELISNNFLQKWWRFSTILVPSPSDSAAILPRLDSYSMANCGMVAQISPSGSSKTSLNSQYEFFANRKTIFDPGISRIAKNATKKNLPKNVNRYRGQIGPSNSSSMVSVIADEWHWLRSLYGIGKLRTRAVAFQPQRGMISCCPMRN